MSVITLFGIPNCDTVKKARRWLDQQQIAYRFHDFRKDGLKPAQVKNWLSKRDWQELLNKRSTTWRDLSESQKCITSTSQAISLLCKYPTLIKRPVLVWDQHVEIGFNPKNYTNLFQT
jgi:arsenate reductase